MRQAVRQRIVWACVVAFSFGYGAAYATVAAVQSGPDIIGLPWAQISAGSLVSLWGGGTATLGRYLTAQVEGRSFNWRVEVLRDLFVSITVGAGAYLAGAWYGLGPLELALALLLSGLLGLRLLTLVGDKFMALVAGRSAP
jgi:hypothetical protein